jgi:hypothetical protein
MKTTDNKKVSEKQIRLAASNFLFNDDLVKAYRKLVKKLDKGKGLDLAANYVKVVQHLDATSVNQMIDLIESAIQPETSQPEFLLKMDWKLLREQKNYLLSTGNETEMMEGVIALFNAIQDYAVDTMGLSEKKVFGKLNEVE